MSNNTISQNQCTSTLSTYGAGLRVLDGAMVSGSNNILYGNTAQIFPDLLGEPTFTYTCCSQVLAGTGNITSNPLFVTGPQGRFYLSQTAAGQPTNSPCVNAGDPSSTMIVGTTRTDQVPDAGIVDMGYHYPITATPPAVDLTLTPVSPPIVIPPTGGSFSYNAQLTNTTTATQTTTVWIKIKLPNGAYYGPVLGPLNLTLPAGASIIRVRNQAIPGSAPVGNYLYVGYDGAYPATISDSSFFAFSKSALSEDGIGVEEWTCTGEPLVANLITSPSDLITVANYPNPFNPSTVARFELPVASHVTLRIYDTAGKLVKTLVDDWREAGTHEITFDGSGLPSGVYVYRLQVGNMAGSGRMTLVK